MSEIPILEIGAGGAFALLVIKEFRHWTTTFMSNKNGGGAGGSTVLRKHGERIASNETEITNIKDVFKESRKDNTKEHEEIKALIINNGKK